MMQQTFARSDSCVFVLVVAFRSIMAEHASIRHYLGVTTSRFTMLCCDTPFVRVATTKNVVGVDTLGARSVTPLSASASPWANVAPAELISVILTSPWTPLIDAVTVSPGDTTCEDNDNAGETGSEVC
jgi:hypothetical protein